MAKSSTETLIRWANQELAHSVGEFLTPTHLKPLVRLCSFVWSYTFWGNCGFVILCGKLLESQLPLKQWFLFFLPHRQGLNDPGPLTAQLKDCSYQVSIIERGPVLVSAFSFIFALIPAPLCSRARGPWPISNSCPGSISSQTHPSLVWLVPFSCPHSHIWVWRAILIVYNSWCVLCPFMSICFSSPITLHILWV